jgi:hypothetical protein
MKLKLNMQIKFESNKNNYKHEFVTILKLLFVVIFGYHRLSAVIFGYHRMTGYQQKVYFTNIPNGNSCSPSHSVHPGVPESQIHVFLSN